MPAIAIGRSTRARAATTPRSTQPRSVSSPASRRRRASSHALPSTQRAAARRAPTTQQPRRRRPISCSGTSPPRGGARTGRRCPRRRLRVAGDDAPAIAPGLRAHRARSRDPRASSPAPGSRTSAAIGSRPRGWPGDSRQGPSGRSPRASRRSCDSDTPRYAYGSLASGADILWAEALLGRGAELHVVLPFARDAFIESSVASSGPGWVERFERCLGAAFSVIYATENAFVPDDALYRYGSELAMGLALLRARYLDADVRQLAVWDGATDRGGGNRARHRHLACRGTGVSVIAPGRRRAGARPATRSIRAGRARDALRGRQGILEARRRAGAARLAARAGGIRRQSSNATPHAIEHQNTWGDALYVVLTDPVEAAECALELQGAMAEIDLRALGLEDQLALRIAGHVGLCSRWRSPCCARSRSPARMSAAPRASSPSRRPARCS